MKAYLEHRRRVLAELRADCALRPFDPKASQLCQIAVDWSEIHAYIFQGPAPSVDPLHGLFRSELVEAVHQAALTVMFERLPNAIILLPPYLQELRAFVQSIGAKASLARLIHDNYHGKSISKLYPESKVAQALEAFVDNWIQRRIGRRRPPREEDIVAFFEADEVRASFEEIGPKKLTKWVDAEFGIVYYLSRIFSADSIKALKQLLYGAGSADPRVTTLEALYPSLTIGGTSGAREALQWYGRLRNVPASEGRRKREEARRWDALALEYLSRLNGWTALRGEQLLFVTRGWDLQCVLNDFASHFTCTLGPYLPFGRDEPVPLCVRSWHHFFELGVAMSAAEHECDLASVIGDRLSAIGTQLECLDAGTKSAEQVRRMCERDLHDAMKKNREIFTSTLRTEIPLGGRAPGKQDLLALFVRYVTNAPEFEKERQRITQSVEGSILEVEEMLDLLYDLDEKQASRPRSFSDLVRAAIRRVPEKMLRHITKDRNKADAIVGLRDLIDRGPLPAGLPDELLDKLTLIRPVQDDTSIENTVSLLARGLAAYVAGAPKRVHFLLSNFASVVTPSLSMPWVLIRVLEADQILQLGPNPVGASALLQEGWLPISDEIGKSVLKVEQELVAMTLLNAWLLLIVDWLDTSETYGVVLIEEEEAAYHSAEFVLREMNRISQHRTIAKWPPALRWFGRGLVNNQLYARTHLAWYYWRKGDAASHKPERAKLKEKAREWSEASETLAMYRSLRIAYEKQPDSSSEADTLGMALLVRAWIDEENRLARSWREDAKNLFRTAARADDGRTRQAAEFHLDTLEREFGEDE